MKYYTICFPGESGQHVQETWSEEQILRAYYPHWFHKMCEASLYKDISDERCIQDWCGIHWAEETDEFGNKL